MAFMIVLLFCYFLKEIGLKVDLFLWFRILFPVLCIILIELMIGGLLFYQQDFKTSLLNLSAVWGEEHFIFHSLYPYNWYISMVFGCITCLQIYYMVSDGQGKKVLWLFVACPGAFYLFLPTAACVVSVIITFILCRFMSKPVQTVIHRISQLHSEMLYCLSLIILASLNAIFIIKQVL